MGRGSLRWDVCVCGGRVEHSLDEAAMHAKALGQAGHGFLEELEGPRGQSTLSGNNPALRLERTRGPEGHWGSHWSPRTPA